MNLFKILTVSNAKKKDQILKKYFFDQKTLLDFGCGDLALSKQLLKYNPKLKITGVDITSLGNKPEGISYIKYDGRKLPFKNKSFDVVLCFYVLHHCADPELSLSECSRVAKKNVIIVESLPRINLEIPFIGIVDWMLNFWKSDPPPITFRFFPKEKWKKLFKKYHLLLASEENITMVTQPSFLPLGKSYLFLCQTEHSI